MKYLVSILLFLLSSYFWLLLNFFPNDWHFSQPFLVAILLLYFFGDNEWLLYSFALLSGLLMDSLSSIFGLNSLCFIIIVFILKILHETKLTKRSFLGTTVISLASFFIYWILMFLLSYIFGHNIYSWANLSYARILYSALINTAIVIVLSIIYLNLRRQKNEIQSF